VLGTQTWGQTWGSRSRTQRLRMITFTSLVGVWSGVGHVAREAAGSKKQRDQLRAAMHDQGCTPEQIAAEMARRFGFRARQAWRHTHGWTQDEVAAAYNRLLDHDQAPMTAKRISDYETWPHGGVKPTINALSMLANVYSTGVSHLIDLDDRGALSTQELLTIDTHKTPPTTPGLPDSPNSDNSATPPSGAGERTPQSDPNISITIRHTNHTPEPATPSARPPWHLGLIPLLAIITVVGSGFIVWAVTANSHPVTPAHAASPPMSLPSAVPIPPSASPRSPAPPLLSATQITPVPPRLPAPLFSLAQTAFAAPPTPATQQPPPPARPEPLAPTSQPPTAQTASAPINAPTTAVTWRNAYYDMCLDEQEGDIIHDPANLELWDCNGANNQTWSEKTIVANPTSIAKNLVSSRSGRCVTYQPGYFGDHAKVWLTPCGKDGQGWIRTWNGAAYMFEAAEVRGMCMSATSGPVTDAAGTYTGILLRRCDTSSPLKDWRFY
jgi:transcriptional regulator with XRE-family HTH domain